jgi:hypothetical protein
MNYVCATHLSTQYHAAGFCCAVIAMLGAASCSGHVNGTGPIVRLGRVRNPTARARKPRIHGPPGTASVVAGTTTTVRKDGRQGAPEACFFHSGASRHPSARITMRSNDKPSVRPTETMDTGQINGTGRIVRPVALRIMRSAGMNPAEASTLDAAPLDHQIAVRRAQGPVVADVGRGDPQRAADLPPHGFSPLVADPSIALAVRQKGVVE